MKDACRFTPVETPCNSKMNLRRIDFNHPDYSELSSDIKLCESHFGYVFGPTLDEERTLLRDYRNEKFRYNKNFNLAKKIAEYFNEYDYKILNYRKVEDAYKKYELVKKLTCRYETCEQKLDSIRKLYTIRIYLPSGREQQNLLYCSKTCWDKIKRRIGLLQKFKPNKIIPIENFF